MVLLAGVEVIQEYAIKMPILTLTISNWTDYFKVEMSHYVPRLIMYRPTLSEHGTRVKISLNMTRLNRVDHRTRHDYNPAWLWRRVYPCAVYIFPRAERA